MTGTAFSLLSAATVNSTSIKASPGVITGLFIYNPSVASKFVKLYDKASAPTVGTDTPKYRLFLPTGAKIEIAGIWLPFATGIGLGTTLLIADADATAIAVADLLINLVYI